tara:strand:+ start:3234 stop:3554 length:321 start_codon:yes stop_codon:yes gene_type:complete
MEQTKGNTKVKNNPMLELELKEVEIQLKKLEVREKESIIKTAEDKADESKTRLLVEQIGQLDGMLQSLVIDEEKSILGSEPKFMRVYNEQELYMIKDKLFKILKKV